MKNSNPQRIAADIAPAPSALMIAFPQAKRVRTIEKIAASIVRAKTQEKGENVLAAAVRKQRAAMTRKGIHSDRINRECRSLESAIRARVWCLILTPNDAA
jgi:Family of unknown function (DUF6074)